MWSWLRSVWAENARSGDLPLIDDLKSTQHLILLLRPLRLDRQPTARQRHGNRQHQQRPNPKLKPPSKDQRRQPPEQHHRQHQSHASDGDQDGVALVPCRPAQPIRQPDQPSHGHRAIDQPRRRGAKPATFLNSVHARQYTPPPEALPEWGPSSPCGRVPAGCQPPEGCRRGEVGRCRWALVVQGVAGQ